MNKPLRGHVAFVSIVIILQFTVESTAQQMPVEKNEVQFPDDFLSFVKSLGSMVYSYKSKDEPQNVKTTIPSSPISSTTQKMKNFRRNEDSMNTQKAALKDVLMMKLVSYYEDKYKLSHHEPTTAEHPEYKNDFTENTTPKPADDYKKGNDAVDIQSDPDVLVL